MKILEITRVVSDIIETDDKEYPYWRRGSVDAWENLMGESWEGMEPPEGLEELYQEAIAARPEEIKMQNGASITFLKTESEKYQSASSTVSARNFCNCNSTLCLTY